MPTKAITPAPQPHADFAILEVREQRVLLDRDVARLFETEVRKLNQSVSRNKQKFSDEFAFKLTWGEFNDLRSQNVIFAEEWAGAKYPPTAFTEYGIVMAATVVRSPKAIEATKLIVRTFVATRREAWEKVTLKRLGNQLPLALDTPLKQGLATKLNIALGHVLDAIISPEDGTTVRDEAKAVAAEGLKTLKAYLKKVGISNEKTLAEVRRIMAEAESDPPPLNWSDLRYAFWHEGGPQCRGRSTSLKRSSRSCGRSTFWFRKARAWPMPSARLG